MVFTFFFFQISPDSDARHKSESLRFGSQTCSGNLQGGLCEIATAAYKARARRREFGEQRTFIRIKLGNKETREKKKVQQLSRFSATSIL